jgi:hypothetical protein
MSKEPSFGTTKGVAMGAYTLAAALLALVAGSQQRADAPPQPGANDVSVTVRYTGKGPVNEAHQILVFLFAEASVDAQSEPLAREVIKENGGVATFRNVAVNPVYVYVVYDEKGDYTGIGGPPPEGTPVGRYMTDPAQATAAPVKPGSKVKMSFGEEWRWRGGL